MRAFPPEYGSDDSKTFKNILMGLGTLARRLLRGLAVASDWLGLLAHRKGALAYGAGHGPG